MGSKAGTADLGTRSVLGAALRLLASAPLRHVVWGLVAGAALSVLVAPALAWALYQALRLLHGGTTLNYDIADLVLSPGGLVLGVLWCAAVAVPAVLAAGGPVLLAEGARVGERPAWRDVVAGTLDATRRLAARGLVRIALWLALVLPGLVAAAGALAAALLAPLGAGPGPRFVRALVTALPWAAPLLLALAAAATWLFLRWALALPFLFLDRLPLAAALERSVATTRGHRAALLRLLLVSLLAAAVLGAALAAGLGLGLRTALRAAHPALDPGGFELVLALLLAADGLVLGALGALAAGFAAAVLVVLRARLVGPEAAATGTPAARAPADPAPSRRGRKVAVAALLLVGTAALTVPAVHREMGRLERHVLVTAHRGSSGQAPENTLAALRLALEEGADLAEIDVQEAADGTIVVLHDETLRRVAGVDRPVWEMTGAELQALDVGRWRDEAYAGEGVPSLEEAIRLVRGRMGLNIEIKVHGHERRLVPSVVEILRRLDFADACVITSLDRATLVEVRRLAPELRLGMIVSASVGRLEALDVDFYSVQPLVATVDFIREAHGAGRDVHVWTLNTEEAVERFVARGADAVITDWPAMARRVLDARGPDDAVRDAVRRLFSP